MTLAFFVLIQYRSVTDRRTDRQTDMSALAIPAVCIARYANALVKNCAKLPYCYCLLLQNFAKFPPTVNFLHKDNKQANIM